MNKYLGYLVRAVPYLIYKYPAIYRASKQKGSRVKRYNDMRSIIKKVLDKLNVEIILTGLKTLPTEPSYLLTPNHQSFMDALCLIAISNQVTTFVAKEEAKKYIYVNKIIKAIEGEYIDRENLRQEIKVMQRIRSSLISENKKWVIFPEGTRSKDKDYKLGEFKAGSFKMAVQAGVDIYPVSMYGSFRILDIKENSLNKQPVFIHIFEPIKKEQYQNMTTVELSEMVKNMIENKQEDLKELDRDFIAKNRKK